MCTEGVVCGAIKSIFMFLDFFCKYVMRGASEFSDKTCCQV